MFCSLGCGNVAIAFSKNGKRGWCNESYNRCPSKIERDKKTRIEKDLKPIWRIHGNEDKHPRGMKGKKPWNAGLKLPDEFGEKISKALKGKPWKALTPESDLARRQKISETMKNNPRAGGYRKGSGRSKSGWYKNIWCDSSWELAWVIFNIDHNIKFERCTEKFEYMWNNKKRNYLPDFKIDNHFIEIKGYKTKQFDAKFNQFPLSLKLTVLYGDDMKSYIDYSISKYGKNFISLYENKEGVKAL